MDRHFTRRAVPNSSFLVIVNNPPGLTSRAGEALGRMMREAEAETGARAVLLWRAILDDGAARDLAGFGWFAEVAAMDDDEWSDLTLRTIVTSSGPVDWVPGVTRRVSGMVPTTTTLHILDELVRHPGQEWYGHRAAEAAAQHIAVAEHLAATTEYLRLHTTLAERGLL